MSETKKSWYKRWWAITLFIFIGLIILGGLFGNDSSNTGTQTTTTQTDNSNTNQVQEQVKTYSLGDTIQAGDFKWKITKVSTTKEIGQDIAGSFFGEKADGIFVILDVEVENTANSAKYLTDSYIKLVDSQGREFSPNTVAAIYLKPEGSALAFEQVNPGITKKGKIVYDVPENVKSFNVKITSSLFSSEVYNVEITI
jgi:hypothetical protein